MSLELYPPIVKADDLSPDEGFGEEIDEDCQLIDESTKGFAKRPDADMVIAAIGAKDATERWKLAHRFKELYNESLSNRMTVKFNGDYGLALTLLAMPIDQAECFMLKTAMDGIGCNEKVVYSILIGRSNDEINRIKANYFKMYTKDLGKKLDKELKGDMEALIFNCYQGCEEIFDPQFHNAERAKHDAEQIYKKGQGKFFGTDEKAIFKVLVAAPPQHVQAIDRAYADKYGITLWKAMEKEMGGLLSGNVGDATLHLIMTKTRPYEAAAAMIKAACRGIGTDEVLLTCCIVRYQHIMKDVMAAHMELYGKSIHDRVRSECTGRYQEVLLTVLNAVWPEEG